MIDEKEIEFVPEARIPLVEVFASMIEQPVGRVEVVNHHALILSHRRQELRVAKGGLLTPHLQDVDHLADVVAAALNQSFCLNRIQNDALPLGHFHSKLLN